MSNGSLIIFLTCLSVISNRYFLFYDFETWLLRYGMVGHHFSLFWRRQVPSVIFIAFIQVMASLAHLSKETAVVVLGKLKMRLTTYAKSVNFMLEQTDLKILNIAGLGLLALYCYLYYYLFFFLIFQTLTKYK
jgi:hypothetical protein